MGDVINSSAQIVPRCLSGEFASSANVVLLYAVLQNAKLLEKIFFGIFKSLQNIFMGDVINSSAGILPRCLSSSLPHRQTSHIGAKNEKICFIV